VIPIAAGSAAAVIVIAVVIGIAIYCKKRSSKEASMSENENRALQEYAVPMSQDNSLSDNHHEEIWQ
jgi:hypothetical protein